MKVAAGIFGFVVLCYLLLAVPALLVYGAALLAGLPHWAAFLVFVVVGLPLGCATLAMAFDWRPWRRGR